MPILGGNQSHDWSYQGDIDELDTDHVHKNYLLDQDIAGQISKHNPSSKKQLEKKSFLPRFLSNFKKWVSKEHIELD